MSQHQICNLDAEGERREFKDHGRAVIATAGGAAFLRGTFEPGWRYSTDVGPLVGATSCQVRHLGYVLAGRMHIAMEDGTQIEVAEGDVFDLPAGHDAWVVGDQRVEMIDTSPESTRYAKGGAAPAAVSEDRYIALVRRGYEAF